MWYGDDQKQADKIDITFYVPLFCADIVSAKILDQLPPALACHCTFLLRFFNCLPDYSGGLFRYRTATE